MKTLAALDFANYNVEKHWHRHHVFNQGSGRGAEIEFARGCPWNCTFCNKQLFRNKFREREVDAVLLEIDRLIARGVDYIYFIDEIFGVGKNVLRLLEEIARAPGPHRLPDPHRPVGRGEARPAGPRPHHLHRVRH